MAWIMIDSEDGEVVGKYPKIADCPEPPSYVTEVTLKWEDD